MHDRKVGHDAREPIRLSLAVLFSLATASVLAALLAWAVVGGWGSP